MLVTTLRPCQLSHLRRFRPCPASSTPLRHPCRPRCLTGKVVNMRKTASIVGIVSRSDLRHRRYLTWIVITNTLSGQKITCPTTPAAGPARRSLARSAHTARQERDRQHTMEITGGKTYGELDTEDPNRDTAMTSSFLQASRPTSVVAFGVAAMAIDVGVAFVLFDARCAGRRPLSRTPRRSRDRARCSSSWVQPGGAVVEVEAASAPLTAHPSTRLSSTRGPRTATAPATVVTSRSA